MVNLFELINETKTVRCAKRFLHKQKIIPKKKLCRNGHQMTLYISESDSMQTAKMPTRNWNKDN